MNEFEVFIFDFPYNNLLKKKYCMARTDQPTQNNKFGVGVSAGAALRASTTDVL